MQIIRASIRIDMVRAVLRSSAIFEKYDARRGPDRRWAHGAVLRMNGLHLTACSRMARGLHRI